MKTQNFSKGRQGEQIASEFLKKKGYQIIKTNYRTRFGEIDIVCSKDNLLVFVEVKLKSGKDFGTPEEMVNQAKIWQVQKTAEAFLWQEKALGEQFKQYRIDAICITLNQDQTANEIRHYENIPLNFQ